MLHWAVRLGLRPLVRLMLLWGATARAKNPAGLTPKELGQRWLDAGASTDLDGLKECLADLAAGLSVLSPLTFLTFSLLVSLSLSSPLSLSHSLSLC